MARPCENAAPSSSDESKGEFPRESSARAFVQTTFARETYEAFGRFEDARAGDLLPPYAASGAIRAEAAEAFAYVDALPSHELRLQMPEVVDGALADDMRVQLGAERCKDMRITFHAARRRMAEGLPTRSCASSTADAIRLVRAAQEEAAVQDDDRTVASCTRLMAALAEGEIGLGDQNAVVARFLERIAPAALGRARSLSTSGDQETAVQVLIDAVGEAAALTGSWTARSPYRSFDSYASRVLYNRARAGARSVGASADAGKRVEVVSIPTTCAIWRSRSFWSTRSSVPKRRCGSASAPSSWGLRRQPATVSWVALTCWWATWRTPPRCWRRDC
ncbi:MAG: hypothetical protein ACLTMP_12130 [Eggerthella lenta]